MIQDQMSKSGVEDRQCPPVVENLDDTRLDDLRSATVPTSFDDPVPDGAESDFYKNRSPELHDVEGRVMQQLYSDTALEFDALTVRRLSEGVLVEGVVRGIDDRPEIEDLSELIRQIAEVSYVENRLLIRGCR